MSSNNGSSWTSVNTGLTDLGIFPLAIKGDTLFAGTSSHGVWKRPLSQMTGIEEINNNAGNIEVYPNPATNNITIESHQKSTMEISKYTRTDNFTTTVTARKNRH